MGGSLLESTDMTSGVINITLSVFGSRARPSICCGAQNKFRPTHIEPRKLRVPLNSSSKF